MTRRRAVLAASVVLLIPGLTGCSFLGIGHKSDSSGTSVFSVKPGQCFLWPTKVKVQLSSIEKIDCSKPHGQEAYASVKYKTAEGSTDYPGDDAIAKFAQGACAEKFGGYVGVNYLDSKLFFTYLAPSARSWQNDDRTVLCFATEAGAPMTGSVKGSGL